MLNSFKYNFYKILGKVTKKYPTNMNVLFRKNGIKIADNARVFSNILTSESFLISVGENTTIASEVHVVTHDASISKFVPGKTDLFGEIKIGNNSFIGAHTVLLYGSSIGDNCIVAAGSVVTKKFIDSGKIIGGNPAKIIGDVDAFVEKKGEFAINRRDLNGDEALKQELYENNKLIIK